MIDNNGFKILEATDLTTGYRVSINNNAEKTVEHVTSKDNPHNVTAGQVGASNPNLLINVNFKEPINQRGQTVYNSVSASPYIYTVDRWRIRGVSAQLTLKSDGVKFGKRSTEVNNGYVIFDTALDNVNALEGKELTVSALVDGKVFMFHVNSGWIFDGSEKILGVVYTVKGMSLALYTTSEDYLYLAFYWGGAYPIGVYSVIEWVKLELGSVATPFTPRPYGEELALCRRYYLKLDNYGNDTCFLGLSQNYNGAYALITLPYDFRLYAPTINFNGNFYLTDTTFTQAGRTPVTDISLSRTAPVGKGIALNVFTGVSNLSGEYKLIFEEGGYLEFDAEIY